MTTAVSGASALGGMGNQAERFGVVELPQTYAVWEVFGCKPREGSLGFASVRFGFARGVWGAICGPAAISGVTLWPSAQECFTM